MGLNAKKDEQYVDGRDKWTVHYSTSEDTRVDPGITKKLFRSAKMG